ncbi:MAG: hypothetical protein ACKO96_02955, partial [Flammeovirgaceae bacterium]
HKTKLWKNCSSDCAELFVFIHRKITINDIPSKSHSPHRDRSIKVEFLVPALVLIGIVDLIVSTGDAFIIGEVKNRTILRA